VKVLGSTFFVRSAEDVAQDLIGCRLSWRHGHQVHSRIITETEAYTGPDDLASHAARGRTERNAPMFGPSGTFYVYFVYGMHSMLNVVTGPVCSTVLIRGVKGSTANETTQDQSDFAWETASKKAGVWFAERQNR
jgi:DNA-3-methyladenine glycosylase